MPILKRRLDGRIFLTLPLLAGAGLLFAASNHAANASRSLQAAPPAGQGGSPPAAPGTQARQEGHLAFADRTADVQAVMRKMYRNDGNYHTLSAVFVNHIPDDRGGSLALTIRQPDYIHELVYANQDASGAPEEEVTSAANGVQFTNLTKSTTTLLPTPAVLGPTDIGQVPLGLIPNVSGPTKVQSFLNGVTGIMADQSVHPGDLITSPLFTNKSVSIESQSTFEGRPVWVLLGKQVPTAPLLVSFGDSWHMMVDKQTGMILRMEFYSGTSEIGWMELRNVVVNGPVVRWSTAQRDHSRSGVPLRRVDPLTYQHLAQGG